jgi:hypothetical protein
MSGEPQRQDSDFDRDFWCAHARRDLTQVFSALAEIRKRAAVR